MNKFILSQFVEILVEAIAKTFFWGANILEIREVGIELTIHHAIKPVPVFLIILFLQLLSCRIIHNKRPNMSKDILHVISEIVVLILTVTII